MPAIAAALRTAVACLHGTWLFAWALWRWLVPLWRFRDVSRGTPEQRIANYRFNREQRGCLLPCLRRWIVVGSLFLLALDGLEQHLQGQALDTTWRPLTVTMIASAGVGFSLAVVIFVVLLVAWVWLERDP
ncbi:MAG: hypothetical protein U1F10_17000 [Burkholderiales bacterium]